MKPPRLPPSPPSVNRAWYCLIINQAATPGLGTVWGGRAVVGRAQLAFALAGFFLLVFWIYRDVFQKSLREMMGESPLPPATAAANLGLVCFGLAWVWAWFSSVSILREAQRHERAKPPRLGIGG